MSTLITRRKVYELVAEHLLGEMSEGRMKPGDAIPTERDLTQSYRVGRSSVREALRMLESQGLIRSLGNGAFVVTGDRHLLNQSLRLLLALDEVNLHELYEVRKILEAEAAALAATRRSDEHLRRIEQTIEQMAAGLNSQELYSRADLQFHLELAAATRNRVIVRMMEGIRDLLHRTLASVYLIPGSPARTLEQHRSILDAIVSGSPDAARSAMLRHLTRVEEDIHSMRVADPRVPGSDEGEEIAGRHSGRPKHDGEH